eukprot:CAMPEP_0194250776 /NCGR_PEP_ID=MMETSP0158-20130606/23907_1 /TAXON_ID=33649 /ORGANISM="Thalassionema nitzschioides, Strain L26-B" /LENGTH=151 /DNA_ID=CAMNT_0038987695 /DNA_START=17 /DNA_END=469 /DNA_ORIENTATION=+
MREYFERLQREIKNLPREKRVKIEKSIQRMEQDYYKEQAMKEDRRGSTTFQRMSSSSPTYVRSTATNKKNPTDLFTPTYVRSAGGTKQNPHPATNKQNRSGRVSGPLKKVTAGGRREHYKAWMGMKTGEETSNTNENVKTFESYSSSSSDT